MKDHQPELELESTDGPRVELVELSALRVACDRLAAEGRVILILEAQGKGLLRGFYRVTSIPRPPARPPPQLCPNV